MQSFSAKWQRDAATQNLFIAGTDVVKCAHTIQGVHNIGIILETPTQRLSGKTVNLCK